MGRPLRIIIPNLPFHILNRGNNRQIVFYDKADFVYYLELLKGLDEGVFSSSQFVEKTKMKFKIGSLRPRGRPRKEKK